MADFQRDYKTYLDLYYRFRPAGLEFIDLRKQLNTLPISDLADDKKRKRLSAALKRKYDEIGYGNDEEATNAREQFQFLLKKIRVIKKRVREYDGNAKRVHEDEGNRYSLAKKLKRNSPKARSIFI